MASIEGFSRSGKGQLSRCFSLSPSPSLLHTLSLLFNRGADQWPLDQKIQRLRFFMFRKTEMRPEFVSFPCVGPWPRLLFLLPGSLVSTQNPFDPSLLLRLLHCGSSVIFIPLAIHLSKDLCIRNWIYRTRSLSDPLFSISIAKSVSNSLALYLLNA